MTSPVSPSETIAKAMEGVELAQRECIFAAQESRKANGADTYAARVLDKAAGVIKALEIQLEAMQREMAELRAERRMIVSHATMGGTDGEGMSVNAVSVEITRLRNHLIEDTRACTLIQGEKK